MGSRPRDNRPRSAPPTTQTDPMPEYERLCDVAEAMEGDEPELQAAPPEGSGA